MHKSRQTQRNHAVVIGGGMAGLLAAFVLSKYFVQVTLLERDHYPDTPAFRSGIPQGRQVHTMLLQGQRILEALFPGLEDKLLAQGAVRRVYGYESLYYYGGRCPKLPPVLHGWNCSRLLLEWQILQELRRCSNIVLREGIEVLHLLGDSSRGCIRGVQFRERNQQTLANPLQEMQADVVVDASGSTSSILNWLQELGYQAPLEVIVNANLGYATRFYQLPEDIHMPWKGIAIQATPQGKRGGVLMEIEGGQWMVVLSGTGKHHPPTEDESYLAFARSLPDPALAEAIELATPLSPIYGYRRTENRRRYFEDQAVLPEGLLVMGDALCTFNPLYGQGMTVAALESQVLERCLSSRFSQKGLTRQFQRQAARVIAFPWLVATAADSQETEKEQKKGMLSRYVERMMTLLPDDPKVLLTFLEVTHMLRSPQALVSPTMLVKVALHSDKGK